MPRWRCSSSSGRWRSTDRRTDMRTANNRRNPDSRNHHDPNWRTARNKNRLACYRSNNRSLRNDITHRVPALDSVKCSSRNPSAESVISTRNMNKSLIALNVLLNVSVSSWSVGTCHRGHQQENNHCKNLGQHKRSLLFPK